MFGITELLVIIRKRVLRSITYIDNMLNISRRNNIIVDVVKNTNNVIQEE